MRPLLEALGKIQSGEVGRLHKQRKDSFLGSLSASSRTKAPSLYERRAARGRGLGLTTQLSDQGEPSGANSVTIQRQHSALEGLNKAKNTENESTRRILQINSKPSTNQ